MKRVFLIGLILAAVTVALWAQTPAIQKTEKAIVLAHFMPWFQTKEFSGRWGIHWSMKNRNPDFIEADGKRQIASYFYPLTGPYDSADPDIIEYQLLLMRLSGINGVALDWSGTTPAYDYAINRANAERLIEALSRYGLRFIIVWEDHNLGLAKVANPIAQGRADLAYAEKKYFARPEYLRIDGRPLFLDFGPQTLNQPRDWEEVFSVLRDKPVFLALWNHGQRAGASAAGEFAWIYQDKRSYMQHLSDFYRDPKLKGIKMAAAAPGFKSFYEAGGWPKNNLEVDYRELRGFADSLDLALAQPAGLIQLVTWNDYGEGTMIEPTNEFGFGFLELLQKRLGLKDCAAADLRLVWQLYQQRREYKAQAAQRERLDAVASALINFNFTQAAALLAKR